MDGRQQHRSYFQSGTSFHRVDGHGAPAGAPITRDSLHDQAPPKERQTVIDGFFEPIPDAKSSRQQRQVDPLMTSEYFKDSAVLSTFDDQDILALYEPETALLPRQISCQAVPTFPDPSAGMQYGLNKNKHGQKLGLSWVHQHPHPPTVQGKKDWPGRFLTQKPIVRNRPLLLIRRGFAVDMIVAQTVPTIGYNMRGQPPPPPLRSTKTTMAKWRGSKACRHQQDQDVDPSEVHAGGVRLRSIQFCKSIRDVVDGSLQSQHLPASSQGAPSVALVEVVGTLASPMRYQNYCWEFAVRDPTAQDFARKYPIAPSPNSCIATPNLDLSNHGTRTLRCRMYDLDNSIDQDALERDEILRIVGITVTQEQVPGPGQDNGLNQVQCVGIRSAFVDEVRTTIQGSHRGLQRGPFQGQI